MVYDQVKELIAMFNNSQLVNFYLELDGNILKMKKDSLLSTKDNSVNILSEDPKISMQNDILYTVPEAFDFIKSPIVGTFYSSPSPTSDSYVKIGSVVKKGDIVCIVEAMKIMNEITSSFDGSIAEILVENGCAVEYGQPLFRLKEN